MFDCYFWNIHVFPTFIFNPYILIITYINKYPVTVQQYLYISEIWHHTATNSPPSNQFQNILLTKRLCEEETHWELIINSIQFTSLQSIDYVFFLMSSTTQTALFSDKNFKKNLIPTLAILKSKVKTDAQTNSHKLCRNFLFVLKSPKIMWII